MLTHYPNTAGSLFFYPFGYDLLTTLSYTIFGVTALAARLPNMIASVLLPLVVFSIGRHIWSSQEGLLAAAFAVTTPYFIEWGGGALVDLPMTLLLMLGVWFALRVEANGASRDWAGLAVSVGAAAQMKPVALYLGVVLWGWLLIRDRQAFRQPTYWLSGLGALGIAGIYFAVGAVLPMIFPTMSWAQDSVFHWFTSAPTHAESGDPSALTLAGMANYAVLLPRQVTLPVTLGGIIGVALAVHRRDNRLGLLFGVFIWTYLFFTLLPNKDWRYTIPLLPVVLLFAARAVTIGIDELPSSRRIAPIAMAAVVLIVGVAGVAGVAGPPQPNPESGIDEAAAYVTDHDSAKVYPYQRSNWVSGNALAWYMYQNDQGLDDEIYRRDLAGADFAITSKPMNLTGYTLAREFGGEKHTTYVYENTNRSG
jgi:4-amino-4-deoxy-L-arabinose transferase-like glycosyltransferase